MKSLLRMIDEMATEAVIKLCNVAEDFRRH